MTLAELKIYVDGLVERGHADNDVLLWPVRHTSGEPPEYRRSPLGSWTPTDVFASGDHVVTVLFEWRPPPGEGLGRSREPVA